MLKIRGYGWGEGGGGQVNKRKETYIRRQDNLRTVDWRDTQKGERTLLGTIADDGRLAEDRAILSQETSTGRVLGISEILMLYVERCE